MCYEEVAPNCPFEHLFSIDEGMEIAQVGDAAKASAPAATPSVKTRRSGVRSLGRNGCSAANRSQLATGLSQDNHSTL